MIEHIVLFQWKVEATQSQIETIVKALQGMKGQIPEIVDISCGENFTSRSKGYTHGLVVRLRDRNSLETYQSHPVHQEIVQQHIKPLLADILAVDYEL